MIPVHINEREFLFLHAINHFHSKASHLPAMTASLEHIHHLYWRAGFGPNVTTFNQQGSTLAKEVELLFEKSKLFIPYTVPDWEMKTNAELKRLSDEEKKAYTKKEKDTHAFIIKEIEDRQAFSESCLREKMTLFWIGLFACRIAKPDFMIKYYNTISEHALGSFSDLLNGMIHNAALLQYLDNDLNKNTHPNENFARELMELFTLGIVIYTENDIKESARAFTGWRFDSYGNYVFLQKVHDEGIKNFMGQSGNFDGNDIARIILEKKECAIYITTRIYKYFVNYKLDPLRITELSNQFYDSGYDIGKLMKTIFSADWFYNKENIGQRIKSPLELQAGITKMFNITFEDPFMRVPVLKVLGQSLFTPPSVAGWPDGLSWIDSSTLLFRIRIPEMYLQDAQSLVVPKENFDAQEKMMMSNPANLSPGKKTKTHYKATYFADRFKNIPAKELTGAMSDFLLMAYPGAAKLKMIDQYTAQSEGTTRILRTAVYLMSLPEYQLS